MLAVLAGIAIGALTSVLQGQLGALDPLFNSAGSWCVVAALLASRTRRPGLAVLIGALVLWSLLGGYLLATELRDLSMSRTFVLFWVACGAVGGPVMGLAGSWLRHHVHLGVGLHRRLTVRLEVPPAQSRGRDHEGLGLVTGGRQAV